MSNAPSSAALHHAVKQSAVILPSTGVYDSSDILTPSDINHSDSPSPFGIIVVGYNEQDGEEILPLYYVSAKAARQRSPASNPLNGEGVKPGWYTVARPDMHYAVRYVSNNNHIKQKRLKKSRTDNSFRVQLSIDGRHVGSNYILHLSKTFEFKRYNGWDGFSRGTTNDRLGCIKTISQFRFAKLGAYQSDQSDQTTTETVAPENFGTIRVDLEVGRAKEKERNYKHTNQDSYKHSTNSVGEKVIAKKGISLKTEAGKSIKCKNTARHYDLIRMKALHALTIEIHVRERTWLKSRNILDEAGNAYSYDDFVKSRSAQAPRTAPNSAIDLTDEPIKLEKEEAKPIIKDEVDLTMEVKPIIKEKVDLTLE